MLCNLLCVIPGPQAMALQLHSIIQREHKITCMFVHVTYINLGRFTSMMVRVTLMDLGQFDAL